MTEQLEALPLVTVALEVGRLACLACGVGVPGPHDVVTSFHSTERLRLVSERMTRCLACAANETTAEAILAEHPAVERSIGGHSVAVYRVASALDALAALHSHGVRTLPLSMLTEDDRAVKMLIALLLPVGAAARWSSRFAPVLAKDATRGTAVLRPWGHLDAPVVQALRDGYAALLRARVTRPRPIPPPADGPRGCLLCGVATVRAMPSADVWTPVKVNVAALGGQPRPEPLPGYLCPPCSHAADEAGGIGPTAMERSLLDHLGVGRSLAATDLVGVIGWCADPKHPEPSQTPWEHLGDQTALVEAIRYGG